MTVTTTGAVKSASGNGATTVWPFDFEIPASADINVYLTNLTTGVVTNLTYATDYSVTGFGVAAGGSITYPLSGTPLAAGSKITIERVIAYLQPNAVPNQGNLFADTVEDICDRVTMMVQQIYALYSRTLRVGNVDDVIGAIPNATLRANTTLGFDADGAPTVGAVATSIIAAALLPFTQAATMAAALTALFTGQSKIGAGTILSGTANVDLAAAATSRASSGTITVNGAVIGDICLGVTADGDANTLGGFLVGQVTAANTVTFFFMNGTAGTLNPAAQNYTAKVLDISTLV